MMISSAMVSVRIFEDDRLSTVKNNPKAGSCGL